MRLQAKELGPAVQDLAVVDLAKDLSETWRAAGRQSSVSRAFHGEQRGIYPPVPGLLSDKDE